MPQVEFPVDPPLAKMLLAAEGLGCANEILTIVAMLSAGGSPFFRPKACYAPVEDCVRCIQPPVR